MSEAGDKYREVGNSSQNEEKISETSSQKEHAENIHYTKNKRIVYWLYLLLGVLFVGAQGYLIAANWREMQDFSESDEFYFSNQITYEWKQGTSINYIGFIIDVKVVSGSSCPSGYEHAVDYFWPGTGFGCFCQPSVNSSFVLEGYCTPLLIQSQCRNIPSQEERNVHFWKNSSNICVKRSKVSF